MDHHEQYEALETELLTIALEGEGLDSVMGSARELATRAGDVAAKAASITKWVADQTALLAKRTTMGLSVFTKAVGPESTVNSDLSAVVALLGVKDSREWDSDIPLPVSANQLVMDSAITSASQIAGNVSSTNDLLQVWCDDHMPAVESYVGDVLKTLKGYSGDDKKLYTDLIASHQKLISNPLYRGLKEKLKLRMPIIKRVYPTSDRLVRGKVLVRMTPSDHRAVLSRKGYMATLKGTRITLTEPDVYDYSPFDNQVMSPGRVSDILEPLKAFTGTRQQYQSIVTGPRLAAVMATISESTEELKKLPKDTLGIRDLWVLYNFINQGLTQLMDPSVELARHHRVVSATLVTVGKLVHRKTK